MIGLDSIGLGCPGGHIHQRLRSAESILSPEGRPLTHNRKAGAGSYPPLLTSAWAREAVKSSTVEAREHPAFDPLQLAAQLDGLVVRRSVASRSRPSASGHGHAPAAQFGRFGDSTDMDPFKKDSELLDGARSLHVGRVFGQHTKAEEARRELARGQLLRRGTWPRVPPV